MLVAGINDGATVTDAGNKGACLGKLREAGFQVPNWVSVSSRAFTTSLSNEQRALLKLIAEVEDNSIRAEMVLRLFGEFRIAEDLIVQITRATESLGCKLLAVRSSAAAEDGIKNSFAGQFDTFLGVRPEDVIPQIIAVWRSAFSARIFEYLKQSHLQFGERFIPCVLVQQMIDAESAGVAFSVDPVSSDEDSAVVEAVFGLGEGLVSGELDADSWTVGKSGTISSVRIASKQHKVQACVRSETGARTALTSVAAHQVDAPSLTDDQVRQVARCARKAQEFFGSPQDIEWCLANGVIYVLQSRPITTLKAPCLESDINVWDNSNISESYPGVTTPLTFSFARKAYEHVYREFLRLMGVSSGTIEKNASVYPCMLGLVKGRMYYNLPSWFKLLAMLPGFGSNADHMGTMMGLKEPLPEPVLRRIRAESAQQKRTEVVGLATAGIALVVNLLLMKTHVKRFEQRVESALILPDGALEKMTSLELGKYYRELESKLLKKWDAPIINDFFAMIFYGILRKLCSGWLGDTQGSLQNQLLVNQSGIISAEPARRIKRMSAIARPDAELVAAFCSGSRAALESVIGRQPELQKELADYLAIFGDRCLEELKLETPTLNDSPELLLRTIGLLASTEVSRPNEFTSTSSECAKPDLSKLNPIKRIIFNFVLAQARERIRQRENLRFLRTRVFGRVRRVFMTIGARFVDSGLLKEQRDVFYLEVEEILAVLEGTNSSTDLGATVNLRRKQFADFAALPEPPVRVVTMGIPCVSADVTAQRDHLPKSTSTPADLHLSGIACSPGRVRGRVRVITDPANSHMEKGEIIVARRTDPGWILLFPLASGLIVEHGSLLSHSAIVSRELGLPAIVGVCKATHLLQDGDVVEFDGRTGDIEIVERKESAHVAA